MDPVTGSGSAAINFGIVTPSTPSKYIGLATLYMDGVRAMAAAEPVPGVALAFVAAQVLELILKAYLIEKGDDEKKLRKDDKVRHNLCELWERAHKSGLPNDLPAPKWVCNLSKVHNSPFDLRYSTTVEVLVLYVGEPMPTELDALVELVRANINSK